MAQGAFVCILLGISQFYVPRKGRQKMTRKKRKEEAWPAFVLICGPICVYLWTLREICHAEVFEINTTIIFLLITHKNPSLCKQKT